jgi:SAM-dependent methyltransferase
MYETDLAWIHHQGFSEFAESASTGILEILWKHGIREGTVVDAGCGSGVLAGELTRAGFTVAGFDASPAMIAIARATAPAARFEVASLGEAGLPPCDAIVSAGEVLNYTTLAEVGAFITSAAAALRPGGVLLFDVAERGSYPPFHETRMGGDDWTVIAIKESDGEHLTRRVLTFRSIGGGIRRSEEVHRLELYDRWDLVGLLRPHFHVRVRRSYGSRRLPKGHAVYECVRRLRVARFRD